MYRIGINTSFLSKPYTGIGQVTTNVLREITARTIFTVGDKKIPSSEITFFLYIDEDVSFFNRDLFRKNGGAKCVPRKVSSWYKRNDLFRKWIFERFLLPHFAKKDQIDIFISLYQSSTVFPWWSKIFHLMVVHDIIPEILPQYNNTVRKRFFWTRIKKGIRFSHKIVAVSQYTKKDIISHYRIHSKKIVVSPIDVDPIFSQPLLQNKVSSVKHHYSLPKEYFFYGGGLEVRKNVENVIYAYKELLEKEESSYIFPDLVISGTLLPHLKPLIVDVEALVRELDLGVRVHIVGNIPQNDLPIFYSEAFCFVFPSLYEGFGMPVLEAMRSGTPVITTKKTSLFEVGGEAVLYCDGTKEGILRAMEEIIYNVHIRKDLRRRGIEQAKLFSWKRFVNTLLEESIIQ
ncbi:MAG: glycosyltransferase family 1 protein [Candidatus Moranbacteria bacterium]|nr:glycosyltransferase family 1 protein [Candidatus Moranbacteria bacterium]